ncbi:coagulation factor IIIa [Heterodontus francisci]|uniref:coagulation factor IIIa n=1 Tax=Heterodontus francisci TaxID=7792 RepID=UPI00355B4C86
MDAANLAITLGFVIIYCNCGLASGTSLKPVTNVTWKSFNFRTTLQWEITSRDSVCTVRIRDSKSDWKKKRECTRIKTTSCDLTSLMQNVTATYIAEVLTYSAKSADPVEEPPFAESASFQPLRDTDIGRATFKLIEKSKNEVELIINDPLTSAKFPNNTEKTLRDIYEPHLSYKVFYWKDGTSGKKTISGKGPIIPVQIDEGVTYCFSIQPHILSPYKNGPESSTQCTRDSKPEYGIGFYALIIIAILVVISIIIGVTVCLCRRRTVHSGTETNPLKAVSA